MTDREVQEDMAQLDKDIRLLAKTVTGRMSWWRRLASYIDNDFEKLDRITRMTAERLYIDYQHAKEALDDFEQMVDDKNVRRQYDGFIVEARAMMMRVYRLLTEVLHKP